MRGYGKCGVHNMDIQYARSGVFTPCDFAFPTDGKRAEATPNTEMILISDVNLNLLNELKHDLDLTYIFVAHDLSVVEYISDRVGVMYLGNFVEVGEKEKIYSNPMHPYTQALLSAVPVPDPTAKRERILLEGSIPSAHKPPTGCKFHTRCPKCMECCKTQAPERYEVDDGHYVYCHLYDKERREQQK